MHQMFDELIGTPPATSIDSRAIVRRDRRTRAALWSTLGATAVAAGLAVAAFTTASTPAGTAPVGAPPTGRSFSLAPDNRLELRSATRAEAEVSAGQLETALNAAVRAAVPAAAWDEKGFDITVIDYTTPLGWIGAAGVTVGKATGSVNVMLHSFPLSRKIDPLSCAVLAADPKLGDQRGDNPSSVPPCVDAKTPSGKQVVTYTLDSRDVKRFEVRIALAGNRVMTVTTGGDEKTPALTSDQLVLIIQQATDRIR